MSWTREEEIEVLRYLREDAGERRARLEREQLRDTAIQRLANEQQLTNAKLDNMNALWNERHSGLAARLEKLEDDVEDTGNFRVDELQRQLEAKKAELAAGAQQRRDSGVWWKRSIVGWVVAAVGALFLAAGGVAWFLFALKFLKT